MNLEKYFSRQDKLYIEKTFKGTPEEYLISLENSCTVFVNDLNEDIKEERIWILFSILGIVKRVIMGINKGSLKFCGFCFVEYEKKEEANAAIVFFKDYLLDGRSIRVSKDMGFTENRQYGRGMFGGRMKTDNWKRRRY
jgi:nuclear cap-binding protein subunit 2